MTINVESIPTENAASCELNQALSVTIPKIENEATNIGDGDRPALTNSSVGTSQRQSAVRFVICSERRTGSHMLATALQRHPQLDVAGEVTQRPSFFKLQSRRKESDAIEGIVRDAVANFNGFIVHRLQLNALRVLARVEGMRVIFLTRNNWLAQLASEMVAMQTKVWHLVKKGENYLSDDGSSKRPAEVPQVMPTLEQCCSFLRELSRRELIALECFRKLPVLFITYERLCHDWDESLNDVLEFLGIEPLPLIPATLKQEERSLSEVVGNLPEIEAAFRETRWELQNDREADEHC